MIFMICSVCDGEFETLQTKRDEEEPDFTKVTVYMKCKTCGCGRIDFHPPVPHNETPSRS